MDLGLKQGCTRRIGSSHTTHPWQDNWLPRKDTMRSTTYIIDDVKVLVEAYIDHDSASWNEDRLNLFLWSMDADIICNIPLAPDNIIG
jgi:hypothetical protein